MTFEPKKIDLEENTTVVVDLDCGTSNPDIGVDLCVVRDKDENGLGEDTEKPSAITLTLGDTLTDEINSTQGDKLEVGAVMSGDDGDGTYFILVSDDDDPTKLDTVYFSGDVDAGESFTALGDDGKFGSETFVHIFSADGGTLLQTINFHTSCSAPLVIGDQYGSISLAGAALEGKDTGTIYQIGNDGGAGDDGVSYAILGGADAALFEVDPDTGEVSFITPPDFENPQDADGDNQYDVIVRATRDDGTFEDKPIEVCVEDDCIKFTENGTTVIVDLDCGTSNPDIGVDLCVVRDKDENGLGEDTEKPSAITLTLGDTLTDEINSTQGDKLEVGAVMSGDDGDGTYFILVSDDDDPTKLDTVYFSGDVDAGESFTALGDDGKFGSETFVHIFSADGGTLLQTINFHTSCSAPLVIGDQYGSISLAGAALEGKDTGTIYQIGNDGGAGDDGVSYAILGGADAALFEVDPDTGEVSFITPPDFENPQDADGDNQYDVIVRATRDDGTFEDKPIEVCVEDDPDDAPICVNENTTPVIDLDIAVPCQKDEGLDLCEVKDDKGYGKPSQISLVYDPDADGVNTQGSKADVTGTNDDDDDAFVIVMDKDGNTLFSGNVTKGDAITFNSLDKTLDSQTFIDIYDSQGGALVQSINLHTSCSAPLVIGESFGSVVLAGGGFTTNGGTLDVYGGTFDDTDVTYSIVGGADASLFQVDPTTGEVSFINAPDFENPQDAGGDNFYDVIVRATSNGDPTCFKEKPLQIEVKDVPEAGALSGTYFCDDDRDGVDDGAPVDPDIAGKTVTLLEADGVTPATDIDGNPVDTVQTDSEGNYRFDNLAARDYVVMFEATDGKAFITPDVGGDDGIDSDVTNPANGKTDPVSVVAGQETTDVDAGVEYLPGALSGTYFCDDDRDGVDDGAPVDPDIAGKTVTLLEADGVTPATDIDGNPVDTVQTDSEGNYRFDNLAARDYVVMFEATDGKAFITPDVGGDDGIDSDVTNPANGKTDPVSVVAGQETTDVDAGVEYLPGALSGTYFCDDDRDGVDDGAPVDPDIAGKTVTLLEADGVTPATDIDGNPVDTVQTDSEGNYRFDNLAARDYVVMFEATDGKAFITPDVGGDDGIDSDVTNPANGKTDPVSVVAGQETTDVDAGVEYLPGALSGTYFCDDDRDGVDDGAPVDPDIAGKTVTLLEADGVTPATDIDGNPVDTVQTDSEGNYRFDNLAARDYVVMFEATDGKAFITPDVGGDDGIDSDVTNPANGKTDPVSVVAGQETTDVDAGVEYLPGALSGTYFCDDDRDGVDDGAPVDPDIAGKTVTLLEADGVTPATDIDGNPVDTVQTDSEGNYRFDNLAARDYVVMFEATDGKAFITPDVGGDDGIDSDVTNPANGKTDPVSVVAGQETTDVDAGVEYLPGALSGTYFCDDDRDGVDDGAPVDPDIAGKTVTLLEADGVTPATDIDGNPVDTVQTDSEGNYRFDNLAARDYVVMFEATDGKAFITPDVGGDDGIDSDVTNPANGKTDPVSVVAGQETTDVDAGVEYLPGALSGTYFCDDDRDGVDDGAPVDPDIAGKTVTLLEADGVTPATDIDGNPVDTVQTDSEGNYRFDNLAARDYVVMFEATDGKAFITPDVGGDDGIDSDVTNPANGKTDPVSVVAGQETTDVDAGVEVVDTGTAALGDKVFIDKNRNGIQDAGDLMLAGVAVILTDAAGVPIGGVPAQVTDGNGNYLFTGLDAGDYRVRFDINTDVFMFTSQNAGGDDAVDSDANPGDGLSDTVTLAIGETNLTVDAGVKSLDPDAQDDMAKTCANEVVMVDVLANDIDDEALTITAVDGQAITDGGAAVNVGGVLVSLVGGKLVFDGETAYQALDIGDEVTQSISYTVSDGLGGEAMADVDVTFCGSAETLDQLFASLPTSGTYQIQADNIALPIAGTAYDLRIDGTGDARFDGVVFEQAYCLSIFDPSLGAESFAAAPVLTADILDGKDGSVFSPGQISIANGQSAADNLDLINWLIAQDFENNGAGAVDGQFSGWEVQRAVWELTDNVDTDYLSAIDPGFGDNADVDFLINAALNPANEGFMAGPGGIATFIVDPNPATGANSQPFIAAFNFDDFDCLC